MYKNRYQPVINSINAMIAICVFGIVSITALLVVAIVVGIQ